MEISVRLITYQWLARRACEITSGKEVANTPGFIDRLYRSEHSPMRTQFFWVEMKGIPSFVSVHFVRHNKGVEHFVESKREDLTGDRKPVDRNTPVTHAMLLNAQALVNLSRKRLCLKAHPKTVEVMKELKEAVSRVDQVLANYMVPECIYRQGCNEPKSCGFFSKLQHEVEEMDRKSFDEMEGKLWRTLRKYPELDFTIQSHFDQEEYVLELELPKGTISKKLNYVDLTNVIGFEDFVHVILENLLKDYNKRYVLYKEETNSDF